MNQRTIIMFLVGLFAAVVIGMFAFAYINRTAEVANQPNEDVAGDTMTPYDNISRIDAKHFFIDGTHTLAGEIALPTPCDLLETDASIAESFPEQVTVDFTVINNSDTCAQAITAQRFLVSFDASVDARIAAKFMGRTIDLNRIPAAEGETPDDFELYIKG